MTWLPTVRNREKENEAFNLAADFVCFGFCWIIPSKISYWVQKYEYKITHLVQKYPNCVPKYIILSTKVYNLVHKCIIQYINIYYWVSKYISDQALKYVRLPTKISQIVFENILDRVLKYFSKTWGQRKHF